MRSGGYGVPLSGAGSDFEARCIETLGVWCQAVLGRSNLVHALQRLSDTFSAELAAVTRVKHEENGGRPDKTQIVAFDRRANFVGELDGFNVASAAAVCGTYLEVAKPGSIWHTDVSDFSSIPRLWAPLSQRRLVQTVVIPLEHHVTNSDFLELHFAMEVHASTLDKLGLLGETLASAWKTRSMGLLSRNAMRKGHLATSGDRNAKENIEILAVENPCKLSRSEYRVCLLLNSGLNNNAILKELSIGKATLRTHLRNIYAKTDTASQPELLQRLLLNASSGMARFSGSSTRAA